MSKVTAVLEKANNRNGYWSILVDGNWYSTYKTDHSDKEGRTVEVEFDAVTKNNKTFYNAKSVTVVESAPAPASGPGNSGGNSYDARQQSIVLQSSFKTAAEVVSAALAADAIAFGNAKKADKLDMIMDCVELTAARIYGSCSNPEDFLAGMAGAMPVGEDDDWNPTEA
jgi:hypothetical protein